MKKIFIILFLLVSLLGCKNEKELNAVEKLESIGYEYYTETLYTDILEYSTFKKKLNDSAINKLMLFDGLAVIIYETEYIKIWINTESLDNLWRFCTIAELDSNQSYNCSEKKDEYYLEIEQAMNEVKTIYESLGFNSHDELLQYLFEVEEIIRLEHQK